MSQSIDERADTLDWMTGAAMTTAGYVARGPEIDYGMRWGRAESVRVSFAPTDQFGNGFLYVHDKERQRYALLAPATTFADVDAAWRSMLTRPVQPSDYLLMADIVAPPVTVEEAQTVWRHCLEDEFAARVAHEAAAVDAPNRFELAHAVVLARTARVSSENLLATAIAAGDTTGYGPATVTYRTLDRDGWTGRALGRDLAEAADMAGHAHDIAELHGYNMQATSFRHGHTIVAASRVPELADVAQPLFDTPSVSF